MITEIVEPITAGIIDKRYPIGYSLSMIRSCVSRERAPFLFVFLTASMLMFWRLGVNALANWDEAWYADASRFMFRNDHNLTPIWNNQYFFDKPPFQYWLTQPFLLIFGEKEIAYRFPSAIASVITVLVVYLWEKHRIGVVGGLTATIALLSFPHFLDRSRSGNFDALFTMWTTLSLYLFTVKKKPIPGGIALGLAWFTKGVFSGFFPIVVVGLFLLYDIFRFHSFRLLSSSLRFTLSAFLTYSPWHLFELIRFERLIDDSYFIAFDQGTFGSWNWIEVADRFNPRYLVFLWTFLRWWFPIALIAIGWSSWRMMKSDANATNKIHSQHSYGDSHHSYRMNRLLFFSPSSHLELFF